jgi:hypothetical protein
MGRTSKSARSQNGVQRVHHIERLSLHTRKILQVTAGGDESLDRKPAHAGF